MKNFKIPVQKTELVYMTVEANTFEEALKKAQNILYNDLDFNYIPSDKYSLFSLDHDFGKEYDADLSKQKVLIEIIKYYKECFPELFEKEV